MSGSGDIALVQWFAAAFPPGGAASPEEAEVLRLLEAARRGDRDAWRGLYSGQVRSVFRAVRALVRDEREAEDVVQEAFLRAFAQLARYRPREGARFASWLAAIALNVARRRARWWRRAAAESEAPELERPSPEPDPGEALDRARRRRSLLAALAGLSTREREIFSLRYGAELTAGEVGEALGLGEANVRKICERVRGKLLAQLERSER